MLTTYVLGAGFSHPAGLPLGHQLFTEIVEAAKSADRYENILKPDLQRYIRFVARTSGERLRIRDLNLERFMSYLDVEHSLRLSGKDTWTNQGNRSQLLIRNLIAKILYRKQWQMTDAAKRLYNHFASKLDSTDIVVTFNYDTVLEDAFDRVGKKYRLFPSRYAEVHPWGGVLKSEDNEVAILKMHGSMDWFDRSGFEEQSREWKRLKYDGTPRDEVFAVKGPRLVPIIDDLYPAESPLNTIYRHRDLNWYLTSASLVRDAPVLISPSFSKILYVNPVREFWYSFGTMASWARKLVIIGFSLPAHDEYIAQALYSLVRNFQHFKLGRRFRKSKLTLVDYRVTPEAIADYERTYRFVDSKQAKMLLNGFGEHTIEQIFGSAS